MKLKSFYLVAALACLHPSAPLWACDLPSNSVYHVDASLTNQRNETLTWEQLHGHPQLVSMFYTNCHMMCPLIIQQAKAVQKQLPQQQQDQLGVSMISLDPVRDTPALLNQTMRDQHVPSSWNLLRPQDNDVRTLASVLGVRYRARDDGSINHTSVLVLFDAKGVEVARTEVKGVAPDPSFVNIVQKTMDEFNNSPSAAL